MKFNDFVNNIKNEIPNYLLGYNIDKISIEKVKKNNATELTSLIIHLKDEEVSPAIYLEYFYNKYCENEDMDETLRNIRNEYINAHNEMLKSPINLEFDKKNIFMKVINYEYNRGLLKNVPFVRVAQDLALTFRVLAYKDNRGIASTLLTYDLLEKFGLKKSEVYELAKVNTQRIFPAKVASLLEIIESMGGDMSGLSDENIFYVLTNDARVNGATCMFYENILKDFKDEYGDFYILPSSIHETLLLRKVDVHEGGLEEFKLMVKEINESVVSPDEKLSDSVYEYDDKINEIIIASDSRERKNEMER